MTTGLGAARRRPSTPIGSISLPLYAGYLRLDPDAFGRLNGAEAIRVYRDMRYNEPSAAAFINACNTLLHHNVDVLPAGNTDGDKVAAELLYAALQSIQPGIGAAIRQMYSVIWAGWDLHEVTYKRTKSGRIVWGEWGLRRQDSLQRWLTDPNDGAKVVGMEQRPAPDFRLREIPLSRAIHIVADDTEGSPEGLSSLRGMYRPWYMVKNIELLMGIALERFGTGIPVFELDADRTAKLTAEDEAVLQNAIAGLRQNEEAGIITPSGVSFKFANSPGLGASDYLDVIQYLRTVMLTTVLADFIALGTSSGGGGAYALGRDKSELFLLALNVYQQRVLDAINTQAVPRLFMWLANQVPGMTLGSDGKPKLPTVTLPPVKRYDLDQLGSFAETLYRIGAFTPSAEDEAYFRRISDMLNRTVEDIAGSKATDQIEDSGEGDVAIPSDSSEASELIAVRDDSGEEASDDSIEQAA